MLKLLNSWQIVLKPGQIKAPLSSTGHRVWLWLGEPHCSDQTGCCSCRERQRERGGCLLGAWPCIYFTLPLCIPICSGLQLGSFPVWTQALQSSLAVDADTEHVSQSPGIYIIHLSRIAQGTNLFWELWWKTTSLHSMDKIMLFTKWLFKKTMGSYCFIFKGREGKRIKKPFLTSKHFILCPVLTLTPRRGLNGVIDQTTHTNTGLQLQPLPTSYWKICVTHFLLLTHIPPHFNFLFSGLVGSEMLWMESTVGKLY